MESQFSIDTRRLTRNYRMDDKIDHVGKMKITEILEDKMYDKLFMML